MFIEAATVAQRYIGVSVGIGMLVILSGSDRVRAQQSAASQAEIRFYDVTTGFTVDAERIIVDGVSLNKAESTERRSKSVLTLAARGTSRCR